MFALSNDQITTSASNRLRRDVASYVSTISSPILDVGG
jgi:hypothetical protein